MMSRKEEIAKAIEQYPNALAAQGGGLVVYNELLFCYVFVLAPEWNPKMLNQPMPEEWGTGPLCMAE